jgi:hypothetical protein
MIEESEERIVDMVIIIYTFVLTVFKRDSLFDKGAFVLATSLGMSLKHML